MNLKFWTRVLLVIVMLSLVGGCIFLPKRDGYVKILLYSGDPTSPTAVVSGLDTLFVGIDGLVAFERYEITIKDSDNKVMAQYILNATEEGKLPPTAMWPDAGLPPVINGGSADPADIEVDSYKVVLKSLEDPDNPHTNVTFPFSVIGRVTPYVTSCDVEGLIKNGYLQGDTVYASGMNFSNDPDDPADDTVNIYIMRDKDIWNFGDRLSDCCVSGPIEATINGDGELIVTNLGQAARQVSGENICYNFDIVVDADRDGLFGPKDAVDAKFAAGYTVQYDPVDPEATNAMQIASNGQALDYTTHWNDQFYYPDEFNYDGSNTGFWWEGFGHGVFCILNPIIDFNYGGGLIPWSQVQVWVIRKADYIDLPNHDYSLAGLDVSDSQGRPDVVWVQQTCSNGAGSILVWQAPLEERRPGQPLVASNDEFVLIVERPGADNYTFENKFHPDSDYVDGDLNGIPDDGTTGFRVVNVPAQQ